jgi:hypothetical protein
MHPHASGACEEAPFADSHGRQRKAGVEMDNRWRIHAEPTETEYKRAVNRFWFRMYRSAMWTKPLLLVGAIALSFSGMNTIVITLAWTAFAISIAQYGVAYRRYWRRNLSLFRENEDHSAVYDFSDDGVAVSAELGSVELKWRAFDQLWQYGDMWLLVARKTQFYLLPTRFLPPDLQEFIARRMRLVGGARPSCEKCGYDLRGQKVARCPECGTPFDADILKIKQ